MAYNPRDIILYPIFTEKSVAINEDNNRLTFAVAKGSNKTQVKLAIEEIFSVKVEKVNILNVKPKTKRFNTKKGVLLGKTSAVRKAIVKLAPGHTIELL